MYHPPKVQKKKPHRDGQCDPRYKFWRMQVLARDKNKCLSCDTKLQVTVWPVLPLRDNPAIAYDVSNGLCLCTECRRWIASGDWVEITRLLIMRSKCEDKENNDG